MAIKDRVKDLRAAKGLSVQGLADASGVSGPYIWQIEAGMKQNPSGKVLKQLASALGTTVADLIGAPLTIPDGTLKNMPPSLRRLARRRGKSLDLRQEDVEMLKTVHFRGKQPRSEQDWELIFLFLKRLLG